MRKHRHLRWWGLYALIPLTIGLAVLDIAAPLAETWRLILLVAIVFVICILALRWAERNPELMESEGADARVTYRLLGDTPINFDTGPEVQVRSSFYAGGQDDWSSVPVRHSLPEDVEQGDH